VQKRRRWNCREQRRPIPTSAPLSAIERIAVLVETPRIGTAEKRPGIKMTDLKDPYVVIYHQTSRGFEYDREGYSIEEFGGVVPAIGDLIVYPGVPADSDRRDPASHTLYEVTRRYFKPAASENYGPRIVLVVQSRLGEKSEGDILFR
jgi:hypothetical protein